MPMVVLSPGWDGVEEGGRAPGAAVRWSLCRRRDRVLAPSGSL